MSSSAVRTWVLPLAATLLFFYLLVFTIPYATGYGWQKVPLIGMLGIMWANPDWEQARFVPFACLLFIYLRRFDLARAPIRGSNGWGTAALLLGIIVYCLGLKAETEYIGFASIQILLAGVILWFWGFRVFSILSFTWLFFVFTWPLHFLDGMVALPLRVLMSHVSSALLNLLGTPTMQNGTAILSAPNSAAGLAMGQRFQIDIADPCSGLHSLFALMMISALTAYLALKKISFRWLLFFAAIPLAVAGNVVRILMLVWGTEAFGASFALGTEENPSAYHMGCGYLVYVVALGLLFALVNLFNSGWIERRLARLDSHKEELPSNAQPASAS